jgi:dephospho-CoA kinase
MMNETARRPRVVAITGGIASGKTAVTDALAAYGVPVFDADVAAREVIAPGTSGLAEIRALFGDEILDASGALNRAAMRKHVFAHPEARRQLEEIIHPRVRVRLQEQAHAAQAPYVVLAIPLLAEVGGRAAYPWIDEVVVVDAPDEARIERLLRRDDISRELAEQMLAAQASRDQRLAIADRVIDNSADLLALQKQAAELHAALLALAGNPPMPEP